ncbi:MAG: hypothetical protein FJ301_06300 [Planctomycetes bacterium]|nr:hypothetical protein [Planctomycetota bacterium]
MSAMNVRSLLLPFAVWFAACGSAPPVPPAPQIDAARSEPAAPVAEPAPGAAPAATPTAVEPVAEPAPFSPPRLRFPTRLTSVSGTALAAQWRALPLAERELRVKSQFAAGNVPDRLAALAPVTVSEEIDGEWRTITVWCAPDYFAIGTDTDDLRMPLSPQTAQWLCDQLDCVLPTPRLVDRIWLQAKAKVIPQPISPKDHDIASLQIFAMHDRMVDAQTCRERPDALVAGHKKDVVLSTLLQAWPDRVVIYGWHRRDGAAIQPKSKAHTTAHVDYSHGVRLIARAALLDGQPTTVDAVLADPKLSVLLSDEGPLATARYPFQPAGGDAGADAGR